jgi:protein-L-isoaspartate(D-aspartate) O-methyltransferase
LILLDGAVEEIPAAIVGQLAPEGRLAGAILDRGVTRLVVGRAAAGSFGLRSLADADVDILPGFERPRAFTF